MTDEAKLSLMS